MVSNNRNSFTFYVMCLVGLHEMSKELLFTVNIILLILMLISHVCKDKLLSDAPVTTRSKGWVCGRSLTGITGSNPSGSVDVCLLLVLCVVR
jgi:hypothetical protein